MDKDTQAYYDAEAEYYRQTKTLPCLVCETKIEVDMGTIEGLNQGEYQTCSLECYEEL